MSFNLRRAKARRRPIDDLRQIVPDIRYSDLETDNDDELSNLVSAIGSPLQKEAVHGRGDNWTEVGPGFNPYNTSPLVNPSPTGWGNGGLRGRNRGLPSSGDQHINDDNDKQKNTKEHGPHSFDDNLRRKWVNDKLERARDREKSERYMVKLELGPEEFGDENMASNIFGEEGQFDGKNVFIEVEDFETAVRIEREQGERGRRVRIESRSNEKED